MRPGRRRAPPEGWGRHSAQRRDVRLKRVPPMGKPSRTGPGDDRNRTVDPADPAVHRDGIGNVGIIHGDPPGSGSERIEPPEMPRIRPHVPVGPLPDLPSEKLPEGPLMGWLNWWSLTRRETESPILTLRYSSKEEASPGAFVIRRLIPREVSRNAGGRCKDPQAYPRQSRTPEPPP